MIFGSLMHFFTIRKKFQKTFKKVLTKGIKCGNIIGRPKKRERNGP